MCSRVKKKIGASSRAYAPQQRMHPLAALDGDELARRLDAMVDSGEVVSRTLSSPSLRIYKYTKPSTGAAMPPRALRGLARGLVMDVEARRIVNLPMPKFEAVAPYSPEPEDHYRRIEGALPEFLQVQPKHDGTCIHAVVRQDGTLLVTSFFSDTSPQALRARQILESGRKWRRGLTLGLELIDEADPKVQKRRVADGLYLFYGAEADGTFLEHAALQELATTIGSVTVVKQRRMAARSVLALLRRMDAVDEAHLVQEGMVGVSPDGTRLKIKSRAYLDVSSAKMPSRIWLTSVVRSAASVEALHRAVEAYEGPLDLPLRARRELVAFLGEVRCLIDRAREFSTPDDVEEIGRQDPALRWILFQARKEAGLLETEYGLLVILKALAREGASFTSR